MDLLPYKFLKHPKVEELEIKGLTVNVGEAIDTPIGQMPGAQLILPRDLPNIMLFPAKNSMVYVSHNFTVNSAQKLTLEGDFNKYFHLYSIPGYETFALEVLSPEFMSSLIECQNKFIVIFALNCAYILLQEPKRLREQDKIELNKAAKALAVNLERKLNTWDDKDAKDSSKKMLTWNNEPSVRFLGDQISYKLFWILVVAVICIVMSVFLTRP